jgi:hypothetical protein
VPAGEEVAPRAGTLSGARAAGTLPRQSPIRQSAEERGGGARLDPIQVRRGPQPGKKTMTISLYDASVACYLQTLAAVAGYLDKGLAHCRGHDIDPGEIVETRLFPDMLPFRFQIQSVVHHSIGAIDALRSGIFRPPADLPVHDYAALQELVVKARDDLGKVSPEEVDARTGAEVMFEIRKSRMPFTAEGFVLSFSLPNFHFHAATAYDILRSRGVPVGKRDFLGALRLKT